MGPENTAEVIEPKTQICIASDVVNSTNLTSVMRTVAPKSCLHNHTVSDRNPDVDYNRSTQRINNYIKCDLDDKYSLLIGIKSKFKSYKPALSE